MSKSLHCPRCKSKDIHCMITNETNVTATGGGYGVGKGCLGYLLLGPLGLLCGACGSKQKISTENHQITMWACKSCGTKFRDLNEIDAQISKVASEEPNKILSIGAICFFVLLFTMQVLTKTPRTFFYSLLFSLFVNAVIFAPVYFISKKQQEKKMDVLYRERNYIIKNAYKDE